jgi:hypothetical protein
MDCGLLPGPSRVAMDFPSHRILFYLGPDYLTPSSFSRAQLMRALADKRARAEIQHCQDIALAQARFASLILLMAPYLNRGLSTI